MKQALEFRHAGIVVRDMERALAFYRDTLGMQVHLDQIEKGSYLEAMLAFPQTQVRTVKLKTLSGGTAGMVELLAFDNPKGISREQTQLNHFGITHFALTVANLDEMHVVLRKAGVRVNSPPVKSPDGGAKILFCQDFEGNWLELVEIIK